MIYSGRRVELLQLFAVPLCRAWQTEYIALSTFKQKNASFD